MDLEQALFDDFFLALFGHYLLMECFLMGVFDDVLHPHDPLSIEIGILDVFVEESLDDMLGCLVAIVLYEIINDEFIYVEEVPALEDIYD